MLGEIVESRANEEKTEAKGSLSSLPLIPDYLRHLILFLPKMEIIPFKLLSKTFNLTIEYFDIFQAFSTRSDLFKYFCEQHGKASSLLYDEKRLIAPYLSQLFGLAESDVSHNLGVISQHYHQFRNGEVISEDGILVCLEYSTVQQHWLNRILYQIPWIANLHITAEKRFHRIALECCSLTKNLEALIWKGLLAVLIQNKLERLVWSAPQTPSRNDLFKILHFRKFNPAYLMDRLPLDLIKICFLNKDFVERLTRTHIMEDFFYNEGRPDTLEERAELLAEAHQDGSQVLKIIENTDDAIHLALASELMAGIVLDEFKLSENEERLITEIHLKIEVLENHEVAGSSSSSSEAEAAHQPAEAAAPAPTPAAAPAVPLVHLPAEAKVSASRAQANLDREGLAAILGLVFAITGAGITLGADSSLLPLGIAFLGAAGLISLTILIRTCYRSQGFFSSRGNASLPVRPTLPIVLVPRLVDSHS